MFFEYASYVREQEEYREMLAEMERDVRDFMEDFRDDPRYLSGWGHAYFCENDGAPLIYDRKKPFSHICPICGRNHTDFLYVTCHTTMYRNEAVGTAVKAAVLYAVTGEDGYLSDVKRIISFYADNYPYFAVHAKEKLNCDPAIDVGGAGKIMPQGLNEAIIALRLVNAMETVKERLDPEWIQEVKEKIFAPVYALLLPQKMHIHNIPIWLNSAFGIMGLFFGEEEWLKEATEHPYNLYQQIEEGLTDSGFWYEGSIHYNFFALEGLMTFLVFAKSYAYPIREEFLEKVKHMLFAAYAYAFDSGRFPNPSDGWPDISLKTYSYVYFMGYKVFGEEILPLLRHIADQPDERTRLPLSEPYYYENRIPLAQLMYAADYREKDTQEPPKRSSALFEDYNCVLLRNETFNVFLKYGHQTKSHAHPDKMNLEILAGGRVLTKDLSNSGYATRICNEWDRSVFSHSTCAVNGKPSDISNPGTLLAFEPDHVSAQAEAYPGVLYQRDVMLSGNLLRDTFRVSCEEESDIDWFFHLEMPVDKTELKLVRCPDKDTDYFREVYRLEPEGESLKLEQELVAMEIFMEPGTSFYLAKTFNNPADRMRDTLIMHRHEKNGVFRMVLTAK